MDVTASIAARATGHCGRNRASSLRDGIIALPLPTNRTMPSSSLPDSVDAVVALLERYDYFADRRLATSVFLALKMRRPLFLEGEAGVGKTEIAKVLSLALSRSLVRLQCYEGLDTASAVYEWNYPRQMIEIRLTEAQGKVDRETLATNIFSERFLIRRPILQALQPDDGIAPVLLIDELDRTDEPFEAYLLEVLAEYQVTIPELGAIKAASPPIVIITSNRTREIHDAIKRRCLYHWVDFPNAERELAIVRRKVPGADAPFARGRCVYAAAARDGLVQVAGDCRNAGLGRGIGRPRPHEPRPGDGGRHAWRVAQIPGRYRRRDTADRGAARCRGTHGSRQGGRGPRLIWPIDRSSGARTWPRISFISRGYCARQGCRCGPAKVIAALEAVEAVGVDNREDFRAALESVLIERHEQQVLFDQAFDLFWRNPQLLERMLQLLLPKIYGRVPPAEAEGAAAVASRRSDGAAPRGPSIEAQEQEIDLDATLSFSSREVLQSKDFETMTVAELAQVKLMIARLRLPLPELPTRRTKPAERGLRSTCARRCAQWPPRAARSFRSPGGAAGRAVHPWLSCAISRARWTATHACCCSFSTPSPTIAIACTTLLFGTRLTNITRHLRQRDVDVAIARVSAAVSDWAGGTRIGACLSGVQPPLVAPPARAGCDRAADHRWSGQRCRRWSFA